MIHKFNATHYDAIIIGARCAGAATGMLMASNGARVLVVDRDTEIRDTLSTHALMRPAVTLLDQWGLLDQIENAGTPVISNTEFHYGNQRFDLPVKPYGRIKGLYAPRRWLLDRVLGSAAEDAGAELRTGTRFVALLKDASGRVEGATLRHPDGSIQDVLAGIVIGADGRQSEVAQAVGAQTIVRSDICSTANYTYLEGLPNTGYRWYYADGIAAGLIPTTNGMHCFFSSCTPDAYSARYKAGAFEGAMEILATWEPEIAADQLRRGPSERMRRFTGTKGFIRDCAGPGWALVGDAGYFKDPLTAHGITDAFLDANRLACALALNPSDARGYQEERDHFAPRMFAVTEKIAALDWTIPEVMAMHLELNNCMKVEHKSLTSSGFAMAA